jgi:hypothetical protein
MCPTSPDEIELDPGDLRQLLARVGQRRAGHHHGGKEGEPDAALDQRRDPAAVYLAHRRPDKPKTQQREQAKGDDEPSPMKLGMRRPQLAENVGVVPIRDIGAK